jgi:hypothetical protein
VISITAREAGALGGTQIDDATTLTCFAQQLCEFGLVVENVRPVCGGIVDQLASTWMKRLAIPRRRPAWLLAARKP